MKVKVRIAVAINENAGCVLVYKDRKHGINRARAIENKVYEKLGVK